MTLEEKTTKRNEVFGGHLIQVYNDEVELPNGDLTHREVVHHPGGASICAIDPDLNVYFVRQFRYPYAKPVLELPAGKLEKGEDPYEAAMRELHEETGLVAEELLPLGEVYPSPGYTDEVIYLYLAIHFDQDAPKPDKDEFLHLEKMPFTQAVNMVMKGELKDGKSQIAILKAYMVLDQLNQAAAQILQEDTSGALGFIDEMDES